MVAALAQVGKDRTSGEIIACAKKYLEKSYVKFIRSVSQSVSVSVGIMLTSASL